MQIFFLSVYFGEYRHTNSLQSPFSCACLPAGGIDGTNTYLHVMETGKIKACMQGVGFVSSAGLCVAVVVHLVGGF